MTLAITKRPVTMVNNRKTRERKMMRPMPTDSPSLILARLLRVVMAFGGVTPPITPCPRLSPHDSLPLYISPDASLTHFFPSTHSPTVVHVPALTSEAKKIKLKITTKKKTSDFFIIVQVFCVVSDLKYTPHHQRK